MIELFRRLLIIWMLLAGVTGCASTGISDSQGTVIEKPISIESAKGWWNAAFCIKWQENSDPAWHIDLLLAHQVVSPVLDSCKADLPFWRFHRRAVRDAYGHVFSFIFFASPETAKQVYETLGSNELLAGMEKEGIIVRRIYTDTNTITKPAIQDMSDSTWSDPVKKAWPYYIMGVSQMWLGLITDFSDRMANGGAVGNVEECQTFYKAVNDRIIRCWQGEGRHALLHHLNAVFGYKPLAFMNTPF